ncbi:PrsW family intramembrane metalloprotease [Dactylosporangium sp. NPDC051541]|uniref:PrsW family intramembrane metalloprotease n=1 Tax=Dactylosporangium sp. NPDC051541 TaxID=3363977 RepID=UPI003788A22A
MSPVSAAAVQRPAPGLDRQRQPIGPREVADRAWVRVLRIALVMGGGFTAAVVLFFAAPGPGPFLVEVPFVLRLMIVAVSVAWLGLLLVRRVHGEQYPGRVLTRGWSVAGTVALLAPLLIQPVINLGSHPLLLAACVPTTAFGLWTMFAVQRHRRLPGRLYLAVFGWGALVAAGLSGALNELFVHYAAAYLDLFTDNPLQAAVAVRPLRGMHAGIVEELAKGAGVAVACLLARRRIDGVVSGAVLGAAAGLGFNFTETVVYMSGADGGAGAQYWARQILGLLAAHTTFSAVLGAAIGAASQQGDQRVRRTAIVCGVLAAAGAHALYNTWTIVQGRLLPDVSDAVQLLVVLPASMLVLQGPLIVLQSLLLRHGLRTQAAGLAAELRAETADPAAAITPPEVPILLDPRRRRALHVAAFRRGGLPALRNLRRLHAAELDLAAGRWHRSRGEPPGDEPEDLAVRRGRVRELKRRHAALMTGGRR